MTERDAFLKAICDDPDDDTARLVFADWLRVPFPHLTHADIENYVPRAFTPFHRVSAQPEAKVG